MKGVVTADRAGSGAKGVGGDLERARARLSREQRIGVAAVGAVVTLRIVLGNVVVNEWESWSVFFGNALAAVVEGFVLGALVFGLIVRPAARARGRRPAVAALVTGLLGVASLAVPYSAPQAIVGAGAVALGLAARERGDGDTGSRLALAAVATGALVVAVWLAFIGVAAATGDWLPTRLVGDF